AEEKRSEAPSAGLPVSVSPPLPVSVSSPLPVSVSPPLPLSPTPARREVVPIDVRLGHRFNLLIITGPNTGGKTVCLKTTGLLCLMAQSGMHIPAADGSVVPIFHQVLADIGDEQSLEQSLSTFSSHMSRIASILRLADTRGLVLLDELGAGTDPTEGAALGRAILDELDRLGCRAMVTTHLGDLKTYAFSHARAEDDADEPTCPADSHAGITRYAYVRVAHVYQATRPVPTFRQRSEAVAGMRPGQSEYRVAEVCQGSDMLRSYAIGDGLEGHLTSV